MAANDAYVDELLRAEEDIEVKSSNLGLLRNEFVLNLDTLQSQYYPKMAPVNAVVFVCREDQSLLGLKIAWQEKKLVMMEQRKHKFMESVDMAPFKKELLDSLSPSFEEAYRAMDAVTKQELEVLRNYEHPPDAVLRTIGVVMALRGEEDRSWASAKVMLSETYYYSFFAYKARMRTKQPLEQATMEELEKYCSEPEMTPEAVLAVSPPCGAMSKWLRALRDLTRIELVSAARRQTADEAREELRSLQENLQRKRDDAAVAEKRLGELLEERNAKIAELRGRYDNTMLPLQELFFDAHQNFNVLYRSPVRTRQYTQTDDSDTA
jgi:hypothetical protein